MNDVSVRLRVLVFIIAAAIAATASPAETFRTGALTENVVSLANPQQTYTLYLPSRYTPEKRWPVLLVFDPRQRGTFAAEIFRDAAEKYGWILVSSNQTLSDGPAQPNIDAVNALWPEVHKRFATDERRIYAAGFSGGAMLALDIATRLPLAGVIGSGGRIDRIVLQKPRFAHFGAAGIHDFNYTEMRHVDDLFAQSAGTHRFESFDGNHRWMPKEVAERGVEWMELVAMRDGLRERDAAFIDELLKRERANADALVAQTHLTAAIRQLRWMSESFRGLADVSDLGEKIRALEADPRTGKERAGEQRWFEYERTMLELLPRALANITESETLTAPGSWRNDLRLNELHSRATRPSFEGEAAQRVLESLFSEFSFYLYREAAQKNDFNRAIAYLTIADEIKPKTPVVLYNLGCAYARTAQRKRALASLKRAVDAGFRDAKAMAADEDLASLRSDAQFKELLASLAAQN